MTFVTISDFIPIVPELILVLTALLVLLVDLFGTQTGNKMTSPLLAIGGFCLAILVEIQLFGGNHTGFIEKWKIRGSTPNAQSDAQCL